MTPLEDGVATFDAIFKAIESANQFIHIQYYIFEEGDLAQRFLTLLKQKKKEGVEVRFMYDDLGSRLLSHNYLNLLKEAGIEVTSFLPMRFGRLMSSLNYRNHRKIVIVDGLVAFTGGINVSDKYIKGDPNLGVWYDMHLQLKGPIVNSLQSVFAIDWSFASGKDDLLSSKYLITHPGIGTSIAQVISSGPDSDFQSIHQLFFQ
ncbi:Cardiolipin synthetase [Winogradskyella psychrotolerans RS-3]|uniref:Cardiolipin synthetase n=1 Tax=Winogradskyella psychrotolerans RS-3 TaxID=641526 RepID=S7VU43_9FLAO|nr:Cardiolipin synthetase [Winogradskyella psychrotolerans RS-3]